MAELRELEKRVEWLDSERQKDKKSINDLLDALASLKEDYAKQSVHVKSLELAVKSYAGLPSQIDQLDQLASKNQTELLKKLQETEKKITVVDKKTEKAIKDELEVINNRMEEFQVELKQIKELKKNLKARVEEEFRIGQRVEETSNFISELRTSDQELQRQITALSGDRPQENKRINDLQLESSALRKRLEEIRNFEEQDKLAISKLDKKIDDLANSEKERLQTQMAFMEKISLSQVEKNTRWKEWEEKYNELQSMGPAISKQILEFEESHRSIKKTQAEFDEVNDRLNRRINEITEMNRLAEERFRQEWITFKSDDQKRWTNYTLARDEESREDDRLLGQTNDRMVKLEDAVQQLQDSFGLMTEETKKQLNGFYATAQELVESFNQAFRKRF